MMSFSDWATEAVTFVLLIGIVLLRILLRKSELPESPQLWGIRWVLNWWLIGTVLVALSDVLNIQEIVSDTVYSGWRRVLYRGCMAIGAWGWVWQFFQRRHT